MLLGAGTLGVHAIGQLPENNGLAQGVTLDVAAVLIAGVASVETGTIRVAGGSAFTRSRRTAQGAVITINASIIPGKAQVGHEINYYDQRGRLTQTVVLWGLTDEQLCSSEIAMAALLDDWDGYALGLYRDAA